jgi:hypothetical protein
MVPRKLAAKLRELASMYPVVVVTGPRQAGKTTLCRATFPDRPYVSLEALDVRDFARTDPRGFIATYRDGAIVDEVRQAPGLLTYLQTEVDERPDAGRFVLTGSQHFGLSEVISQSLAGRCGLLTLLPPDWEELRQFPNAPGDLLTALFQGAYPRIYDRGIPAHQWLADYTATYVERDVRQALNVGNLTTFSSFMRLCAGRVAQEINLSALGTDAAISHNTARAWLSVLDASYLVQRLPAWHANIRKQVVKAAKLHFLDSGLLCYLLNIREPEQLRHHPLRGAIFESWVVSELYKATLNRGERPDFYHYRESRGVEMDVIVNRGDRLIAVESKSAATVAPEFFKHFEPLAERLLGTSLPQRIERVVVYGGDDTQERSAGRVVGWRDVDTLLASVEA